MERQAACQLRLLLAAVLGLLAGYPAQAQNESETHETRHKLFPIDPKSYLLGHFRPDTTPDFVRLSQTLTSGPSSYLRSAVATAVAELVQAAAGDGVRLEVISATRSFQGQRMIWDSKFTGERLAAGRNLAEEYPDTTARCLAILQYSSAPGTSRHHWGTEVDFNRTGQAYWRQGEGLVALTWLERHAVRFGFVMAYPPDREHGYAYEPWHWSYQPLARPLLRSYYHQLVGPEDIAGFAGAGAVRKLKWKAWYVYGVNEVLK